MGQREIQLEQDKYLLNRDQGIEDEMKGEEKALSGIMSKDSLPNQKRVQIWN